MQLKRNWKRGDPNLPTKGPPGFDLSLSAHKEEEHGALLDLQKYLRDWRRWTRQWSEDLGFPHEVNFVHLMVPHISGWSHHEDIDDSISIHVMHAIDAEVENLSALKKAAVRLVYLNEILPAVFRSNRWDRQAVNRLCFEAENEMIPRLRVRGVVLGGR